MATDLLTPPAAGVEPHTARPGSPRLVAVQARHNLAAFVRTPVAAFFTIVFPLSFLIIIGAAVGSQLTTEGIRVSQYLVTPFSVYGVAAETFCILATSMATARESGVLKRLRGTPVPPWTVIAGRIVAAAVVSLASVTILVTVGVAGYGVQVIWAKLPAALVTLLFGIVCFTSLGLAVAALCRSVLAVQAATNGLLIPLAFISNVFIVGATLPTWLDWISKALPLRHFADAMQGTFDPVHGGTGFAWTDLAALAGWAVAGVAVALWHFEWEPRLGERRGVAAAAGDEPVPTRAVTTLSGRDVGRPSLATLLSGQVRYALTAMRRDRSPLFFAIVFPALLLVLFPVVFHHGTVHGMRVADFMLPGMIVYAVAVAAYVNIPEQIVRARAAGVLKRLRGSPLPTSTYVTGRLLGGLVVALAATVVLLEVGSGANGTPISWVRLPSVLLTVVMATFCFGALGLALLTLMSSAQSLIPVTLGTLMPLTFLSDVFYTGADLPHAFQVVGDVFPLKHAVYALMAALRPDATGAGFAWGHLAVVAAWAVAGLLVARHLPWQARTPSERR